MTVELTKLFRVLLLAYFLGSGILIALLLGLQQFQADKRSQLQLQQYAELLKVSLRPFLAQAAREPLNSQLLELYYSALLPVAAIGIYDANGEPLASTGLVQALPAHLAKTTVKSSQLPLLHNSNAVIVPIVGHANTADPVLSFQNAESYLVIVSEEVVDKGQFLLLTTLVWLIYSLIFLGFAGYLQRWLMQRHTSLLAMLEVAGKISTAEHATPLDTMFGANIGSTELNLVRGHLALLAQRLNTTQLQQQQQQEEQVSLQQALLDMTEQQQHTEQQWQSLQQAIVLWLTHIQLIWQRQEQFSAPVFFALMRLQLLYGFYQFNSLKLDETTITLNHWLAKQLADLNRLLPQAVNIDWLEGEANTGVQVVLDSAALQAILQALLLLALRSEQLTRIAVRLTIEQSTDPQLVIHLNCDGQGLAPDLNKLLKSAKLVQWQWRDIDIVVLQRLADEFNAKLNVQSLEGLGLSIKLHMPIKVSELPFKAKIGHVVVFDEDAERLKERLVALKALAIQVTGCQVFAELEQLLAKSIPDLLLVMLPHSAPNQQWLTFIDRYRQQYHSYVFAPASYLAQWQTLTSCHSANEFCLTLLAEQPLAEKSIMQYKKLLVVDDNETNQAFIRILLQHKAVDFKAALMGLEALQLCQQEQFDLILLDISLPDISGVEVARQLRLVPAYKKTPILAFTAHALPAEIAEFKLAGMDDILLKPLDPAKFETLLARYQLY